LQTNLIAEAEAIRPKEVNVNVSGPAVALKFEVMMLNILQAVTHF
jgi:hypothetical protein